MKFRHFCAKSSLFSSNLNLEGSPESASKSKKLHTIVTFVRLSFLYIVRPKKVQKFNYSALMSPRLKPIQLDHYETNNLVRKVYARYFVSRENCGT